MNRTTLIIAGIVILLLISLVWVYLLMFGTPKSTQDVFTHLGFVSTTRPTTVAQTNTSQTTTTNSPTTGSTILKQLTTRPVAGFTFMDGTASTSASTSSETVRYVERGTGHIYSIDLNSDAETLIANTTLPQVSAAVFSPDGSTVAFTSYVGYEHKVFVGTINSDQTVTGSDLPTNAKNIAFQNNHTILYTVSQNGTTIGYAQNLTQSTRSELFAVKFANIKMVWGAGHTDTYLVTKPDARYQGFVYKVVNGNLLPITSPQYGLTAFASDQQLVASYVSGGNYVSAAYNTKTGSTTQLPILALPSKCAPSSIASSTIWCAAPLGTIPSTYLTAWYQGTLRSNDYIWRVSVPTSRAALSADPQKLAGTSLDIDHVSIDPSGTHLLLQNKSDQTLWLMNI